jgi:hypothetical protein
VGLTTRLIARQANRCTGHFWESLYKSQAIVSEEAQLTCMAYVDLNPIRAIMCNTPEKSDYTIIIERMIPNLGLKGISKNALFPRLRSWPRGPYCWQLRARSLIYYGFIWLSKRISPNKIGNRQIILSWDTSLYYHLFNLLSSLKD